MKQTLVKICGLTREQDVQAACAAGADFIGFVQYAKSSRYIDLQTLNRLLSVVPPEVQVVFLFVNATKLDVDQVLSVHQKHPHLKKPILQFHGDESPKECHLLAQGHDYWAVARIPQSVTFHYQAELLKYAGLHAGASALLLDTLVDGFGGSGQSFNYSAFNWLQLKQNVSTPLVLSGGLTAANVAAGIAQVRPWAVDVSSGVESSKGIKDATKISEFIAAVRQKDAAN